MLLNLKSHEVTSAAQFASRVGWELLIWDPTILATISEVANVVSRFFLGATLLAILPLSEVMRCEHKKYSIGFEQLCLMFAVFYYSIFSF